MGFEPMNLFKLVHDLSHAETFQNELTERNKGKRIGYIDWAQTPILSIRFTIYDELALLGSCLKMGGLTPRLQILGDEPHDGFTEIFGHYNLS